MPKTLGLLLLVCMLLSCADEKVQLIGKRNSAIQKRDYPVYLSTWSEASRRDRENKGYAANLEWNLLTSRPPVLRKVVKIGPDYVVVEEEFNGERMRGRYTFVREGGRWRIDEHGLE